jgi:IS30 family transposase
MTDRATLMTMIEKLPRKNREEVYQKMNERLSRFGACWITIITFDNGMEFARNAKLAKDFNAKTYFTRLYTSHNKGTIENRIGVIRRFLLKKTDL